MKPKPIEIPEQQEHQEPIRLSVNCVIGSIHYVAGETLPFTADSLPEALRPFIASDDEPELEEEGNACFAANTVYAVTHQGRAGRRIHREIAELEVADEAKAWAEQELSRPVRADLEDALTAANEERVGRAMAEAQAEARWHDEVSRIGEGDEL